MKSGIELIAAERQEQIEKHGRTIKSDIANNKDFQLSYAASTLCCENWDGLSLEDVIAEYCPEGWDAKIWESMMRKPYEQRIIIAGALIAAEIDRLQATQTQ